MRVKNRKWLCDYMPELDGLFGPREKKVWQALRKIYCEGEEASLQHYYQLVTIVDGTPVDPENTGFEAMKGIRRKVEHYFTHDPEGRKSRRIISFAADHIHLRVSCRPIGQFIWNNLQDSALNIEGLAKTDFGYILTTWLRAYAASIDFIAHIRNGRCSAPGTLDTR